MDISDDDIKKDDEKQCIIVKRLINQYIGKCIDGCDGCDEKKICTHTPSRFRMCKGIRQKIINILMKSCASGYINSVREIIENDILIEIDINVVETEHGYSALYTACLFNNSEIVDYLIKTGGEHINLDIENKYGETPIVASYYFDCIECILLLRANGARLPIGNYDSYLSAFSKRVLEYVNRYNIYSNEYLNSCQEFINQYILSDLTNIVIGYVCPKDLESVRNFLFNMKQ